MTDVKKALRDALRELKEKQAELGREEASIRRALKALNGEDSQSSRPSKKRRTRRNPEVTVSYEERMDQILAAMGSGRTMTYADMRALGVPSGSQTELRDRLLSTGHVVKIGETDTGGPILALRSSSHDHAPSNGAGVTA